MAKGAMKKVRERAATEKQKQDEQVNTQSVSQDNTIVRQYRGFNYRLTVVDGKIINIAFVENQCVEQYDDDHRTFCNGLCTRSGPYTKNALTYFQKML